MSDFVSIGLDLGSTRIKAACLRADGSLGEVVAENAPPLQHDDLLVEGDPMAYLETASRVLEKLNPDKALPLGIACQRSSFVVWEEETGTPVTQMISWQDRRAASWCEDLKEFEKRITGITGLPLSPHYFAPKLASLLDADPDLRVRIENGELLAGTLDAFILWNWTGGEAFETDVSMAGRTLLLDMKTLHWSHDLLDFFGISEEALPVVTPSVREPLPLNNGFTLGGLMADQAASLHAITGSKPGKMFLVNMGTGIFVLKASTEAERVPGLLTGPTYSDGKTMSYALEGTLNAGGAALDAFGTAPALEKQETLLNIFCLPDESGAGAPHWKPEIGTTFSDEKLDVSGKKYFFREGLCFRIREILELMGWDPGHDKIFLSGGLGADALMQELLPGVLGQSVVFLDEKETTLAGAAMVASGKSVLPMDAGQVLAPQPSLKHLYKKYYLWKEWVSGVLS